MLPKVIGVNLRLLAYADTLVGFLSQKYYSFGFSHPEPSKQFTPEKKQEEVPTGCGSRIGDGWQHGAKQQPNGARLTDQFTSSSTHRL